MKSGLHRSSGGATCDVAVIGAGFGGLAAALSLAERGARVVLCEALRYPGGCASTFTRRGGAFARSRSSTSAERRVNIPGAVVIAADRKANPNRSPPR